jgi:hypothetical protein
MRRARAGLLALALATCAATAPAFVLSEQLRVRGTDRDVALRMLTFDPRQAQLRILSVPFDVGADDADLRGVAAALQRRSELRAPAWAVLSGGLSSYRTDVALGLLVADGKVYSRLSSETVGARDATSPLRWAGVLCQQAADRRWLIVLAKSYRGGQCVNALQAGPLLVEPGGAVGISDGEPQRSRPYERAVVCLLRDGRMRFVVALQPIHLLPLARWLAAPEPRGAGCTAALNLAGDSSAGLFVQPRAPSARGARPASALYGPASFPLPSVLLVQQPAR